jgi:uncharacterized protein (DUF302 family)
MAAARAAASIEYSRRGPAMVNQLHERQTIRVGSATARVRKFGLRERINMTAIHGISQVERASPFSFELTVLRLSQAISKAGMEVFAMIDHAANARAVGLSMPGAVVLIYGKAQGGTPIMLASPRSALELPLHVLVREEADGRTIVSFHAIATLLKAAGVPAALASRLEPAQDLLFKAIEP